MRTLLILLLKPEYLEFLLLFSHTNYVSNPTKKTQSLPPKYQIGQLLSLLCYFFSQTVPISYLETAFIPDLASLLPDLLHFNSIFVS